MERRTFLRVALATVLSPLAAACEADGAIDIGGPRPASRGDLASAGKYYPEGVLNQNIEVEGLCNIWMDGEDLGPRQASGLPVNGETYAIATWRFNMGSKVLVTDIDTGRSIVAVVTDRGPNEIKYPGHICDITPLVAREIVNGKRRNIRIRLSPQN